MQNPISEEAIRFGSPDLSMYHHQSWEGGNGISNAASHTHGIWMATLSSRACQHHHWLERAHHAISSKLATRKTDTKPAALLEFPKFRTERSGAVLIKQKTQRCTTSIFRKKPPTKPPIPNTRNLLKTMCGPGVLSRGETPRLVYPSSYTCYITPSSRSNSSFAFSRETAQLKFVCKELLCTPRASPANERADNPARLVPAPPSLPLLDGWMKKSVTHLRCAVQTLRMEGRRVRPGSACST